MDLNEHAVTVLIGRRVKAGCEADSEHASQGLRAAVLCIGAPLRMRPGSRT
ncbi:MAG: hypothetical protein QM777_12440 [Pseudorhodoferax sp.]